MGRRVGEVFGVSGVSGVESSARRFLRGTLTDVLGDVLALRIFLSRPELLRSISLLPAISSSTVSLGIGSIFSSRCKCVIPIHIFHRFAHPGFLQVQYIVMGSSAPLVCAKWKSTSLHPHFAHLTPAEPSPSPKSFSATMASRR